MFSTEISEYIKFSSSLYSFSVVPKELVGLNGIRIGCRIYSNNGVMLLCLPSLYDNFIFKSFILPLNYKASQNDWQEYKIPIVNKSPLLELTTLYEWSSFHFISFHFSFFISFQCLSFLMSGIQVFLVLGSWGYFDLKY